MTTIVKNMNQSRREFLRTAGRLSIAGTAAPFALNLAIYLVMSSPEYIFQN